MSSNRLIKIGFVLSLVAIGLNFSSCKKEDSETKQTPLYQCIGYDCIETIDGFYATYSECYTACVDPNDNDPNDNPNDTSSNNPIIVDVQAGLNEGYSPFELIDYGFSVSELYGKWYQGGEIFYVDRALGKGLVHSITPISYNNVTVNYHCELQVPLSDAIFGGAANNTTIVSNCPNFDAFVRAANLSLNFYDFDTYSDWYIPNEGELDALFNNRTFDQNTHAYYYMNNYVWSSSTSDEYASGTAPYFVTLYNTGAKDLVDNEEAATDPFFQQVWRVPFTWGDNADLIVIRQFTE